MNRSTRTLLVVGIALVVAGAATYLVFQAIQNRPTREVEVASAYAVVAARALPLGTRIAATDVKVVAWPAANMVPGGFTTVEEVVDRGVRSPISENEPLTGNNVATKEAGSGLSPTIPPGMRAVSVRVNEVIGVAGFVVPGTRVDVLVVVSEGTQSLARIVVDNVQVLAAGTQYDQELAREGKAVPSSVVTLLVNPKDAELVTLASIQGQIMLTLRNPTDAAPVGVTGVRTSNLRGDTSTAPPVEAPRTTVVRSKPAAPAVQPPPAPTGPKVYAVETIRAAKRSEETVK